MVLNKGDLTTLFRTILLIVHHLPCYTLLLLFGTADFLEHKDLSQNLQVILLYILGYTIHPFLFLLD